MFDASSGHWRAGKLSAARMRLEAATAGGRAFFVGGMGETEDCGATCNAVDVYDPLHDAWSVTTLTRGRYEFAAVGVGGALETDGAHLLVTGGKQDTAAGPDTDGKWDLVERYNSQRKGTSHGHWSNQVVPAEARSYISAAAHPLSPGKSVVLVAGGDFQNGTCTDFVEALSL